MIALVWLKDEIHERRFNFYNIESGFDYMLPEEEQKILHKTCHYTTMLDIQLVSSQRVLIYFLILIFLIVRMDSVG